MRSAPRKFGGRFNFGQPIRAGRNLYLPALRRYRRSSPVRLSSIRISQAIVNLCQISMRGNKPGSDLNRGFEGHGGLALLLVVRKGHAQVEVNLGTSVALDDCRSEGFLGVFELSTAMVSNAELIQHRGIPGKKRNSLDQGSLSVLIAAEAQGHITHPNPRLCDRRIEPSGGFIL